MAPKRIFIGSAQETLAIASAVAQAFADYKYKPIRWWQEFPPGSITIDRLLEVATAVDGAVFLCTPEDKTWYRQELVNSPRDNLLLEYGIFIAHLGRHRTVIGTQEGTKLPSDISAINYALISDDTTSFAERLVHHFNKEFAQPLPSVEATTLISDPVVLERIIAELTPHSWHQRNLYIGIEGARRWLAVGSAADYRTKEQARHLNRFLLKAVENAPVRTFVSLGPGEAENDKEIAIRLREQDPFVNYIPVDISHGLVQRAAAHLSDFLRVPVGILGDFEDRLPFIIRQIRRYGIPPFLIALLGNTIGNLDGYERTFLHNVSDLIGEGNTLLLSVSLKGPSWSLSSDRRFQHIGYSQPTRRFIAHGLARQTGESSDTILSSFESRIAFEEGGSDVPDAVAIDVVDTKSGKLVISVRRYDWQALLDWMRNDMKYHILYSQYVSFSEETGYGVILLRKA